MRFRHHDTRPEQGNLGGLPVLSRARSGAGGAESGMGRGTTRHLAEPPAAKLQRVTAEWGFTDLEMRDVISAGAVNAIEATVAAGASPQSARKWWLTEVARRANEAGVDLGRRDKPASGRNPGTGRESTINDKLRDRCSKV